MSGPMSHVRTHVRTTLSCSDLHDVTNSITEIPQVGVPLSELRVKLHLYVRECVQVWGNICMYDSMYRCGETAVWMAVCTGVGKLLYV